MKGPKAAGTEDTVCAERAADGGDISDDKTVASFVMDATALDQGHGDLENLGGGVRKGDQLGRYVIVKRLGEGGMGVVYAAYDPKLDRKVAIKLLHGGRNAATDTQARARLRREAQALARLSAPCVVGIHDVGTWKRQVWIAMEFVDGVTLTDWMQTTRTFAEVREILLQAGKGLVVAHAAGLAHRDFKPDNVMIGKDGRVRVMDFGLARSTNQADDEENESDEESKPSDTSPPLDQSMTHAGAIIGTPVYMAPEQITGNKAGVAADQFSFCVVLWECLFGARPFAGTDLVSLAASIGESAPGPIPSDHSAPPHVVDLLLKGLAKKPTARWPDMQTLLAELERDPVRQRRRRIAFAVAASVLVGGGALAGQVLLGASPSDPCADAATRGSEVWNRDKAQHLREVFSAVGPFGADTATQVIARFDSWRDDWEQASVRACKTAQSGKESASLIDSRSFCLDRRLAQMESLREVLDEADQSVVSKATRAAHDLLGSEDCFDSKLLLAEVPPPAARELRQQVDGLEERLDRVLALRKVSRFEEALKELEALMAEIKATPYPPLQAEAIGMRGTLRLALSKEGALEDLKKSYWIAYESGLRVFAATVAIEVLRAYHALDQHEEGLEWEPQARAAVALLGNPPAKLANLERGISALYGKAAPEKALHHAQRAVSTIESYDEASHFAKGDAFANMGSIMFRQGKFTEALEWQQRSLEELRASGTPESSPIWVPILANLAATQLSAKDLVSAEASIRRAVAVGEGAFGPEAASLAIPLNTLASLLGMQKKYEDSALVFKRTLDIRESHLGFSHSFTVATLDNLGMVYRLQERVDLVQSTAASFRARHLAKAGPDSLELVSTIRLQAKLLRSVNKNAEAAEVLAEALALATRLSAGDETLAQLHFAIAIALGRGPNWPVAKKHAKLAKSLWTTRGPDSKHDIDKVESWLSEAR